MLSTLRISLVSIVAIVLMVSIGCTSEEETNESPLGDGSEQSISSDEVAPGEATLYTVWPFDADEALRRQEETAETHDIPVEYENKIGMKFRLIPAGEFMMGSPEVEEDHYSDEGPVHCVRLTQPYYVSAHEVTQSQWEEVMGTTLADLKDTDWHYVGQGPHNPMYWISWFDAVAFCNALSEREGKSPYYKMTNVERADYGREPGIESATVKILGGLGYRLPSEAEWENACRAGCEDPYYGEVDEIAWHSDNSYKKMRSVGEKLPNSFGLFDLHGSVWEWCGDFYDKDYYSVSQMTNPTGPSTGIVRVFRGGSFNNHARTCRSANRFGSTPDCRNSRVSGFRLACSAE